MPIFISLLRGINVGGNKIIKMSTLKTLYEALGFSQVTTLLQGGNVVFTAEETTPAELTLKIEAAIVATYGFESKIVLRTPEQWRGVSLHHPFSDDQMQDPSKILVYFLCAVPDETQVNDFIAQYTGVEQMTLRGDALYIYYPDGMGRSKLDNALIEKKTKLIGTGRNWNTIQKLLALVDLPA